MIVAREWAMPNANTFTIIPIRNLVRDVCRDARARSGEDAVIVDPFANNAQYGTITNDLNPEYSTDFHMDALAFLEGQPSDSADLVLYDPPYSITQAAEMYRSYGREKLDTSVANMAYWAKCKDEIARIVKPGGGALCCGWNSNGIGMCRGFYMANLLIVAHGGSKNDTIVTYEIKKGTQMRWEI